MQKRTKNRRNKKQRHNAFENLESRQLYSVVMANPGNFQSVINSSNAGDTISFASGNYNFKGSIAFPSNRTYVGNGAVLNGGGSGSDLLNEANVSNVDISGFVLKGVSTCGDNANGLNFHNNVIENLNANGFREGGMQNSRVNNNTFTNISDQAVYGYPGSGNQFNNNRFDYCVEAIHLAASTCDNTQVNGNVITHTTRIGIELQSKMSNLQVENNYISDFLQQGTGNNNSHMGISCATGYGSNITISGNVLIQNGPAQNIGLGNMAGIEIFGGSGCVISNNYGWNWNCLILNGIEPVGLTSKNNVEVGGHLSDYDSVGGAYSIGPIYSTNDKVYSLNDSSAPTWPAMPTTAGATSTATTSTPIVVTSSAPAVSIAAPTNFVAQSPSSTEVDLSWTDNTKGAATYLLQRRATHGSTGFQTIATLAAGKTSYTDTSVNANWEYDYQLTAVVSGASSSVVAVHTQVQAVPAPVVTTPVVTTPVVTTPVVTTPVVTTPVVSTPAPTATTAAPTNVTVAAAGPGQITVSWTAGQGVPTIYIYPTRGAGGAAAALNLGQLAAGSTSATISGINNNWEVIAEVSFTSNGVESAKTTAPNIKVVNSTVAPSATFAPALVTTAAATQTTTTTTTSTTPVATSDLPAPTNFTATSPNSGEVDLSWTDNTSGAATYILERRPTRGSTGYQAIASIAAGVTSYSDVHVNANWEYDYILTAVQSGVGSSAASTSVQVLNSVTATVTTTTTAVTAAATDAATPTDVPVAASNPTNVDPTSADNSAATPTSVVDTGSSTKTKAAKTVAKRPAAVTVYTVTNRLTAAA